MDFKKVFAVLIVALFLLSSISFAYAEDSSDDMSYDVVYSGYDATHNEEYIYEEYIYEELDKPTENETNGYYSSNYDMLNQCGGNVIKDSNIDSKFVKIQFQLCWSKSDKLKENFRKNIKHNSKIPGSEIDMLKKKLMIIDSFKVSAGLKLLNKKYDVAYRNIKVANKRLDELEKLMDEVINKY